MITVCEQVATSPAHAVDPVVTISTPAAATHKVVVRGATKKRTGKDVMTVVAAHGRAEDPRLAHILV